MELTTIIPWGLAATGIFSTIYFASKARSDKAQDIRCEAIHSHTLGPLYEKLNSLENRMASIQASKIHNGGFERLTQMVQDLHDRIPGGKK